MTVAQSTSRGPKRIVKIQGKQHEIDLDNPYIFVPTEKQRQLWETVKANAKPNAITLIGYGGAAGGGKSRAIIELAVDLALAYPGNRILIGRRDFNDLSSTIIEPFFRHTHPDLIVARNNVEHWVKIRQRNWPKNVVSQIRFRELKDWVGLGSEEYGAVLVDEAAEVSTDASLMLLSRLRWRLPHEIESKGLKLAYYFIAASNPFPGWFKEWFVDRKLPEDLLAQANVKVYFIPALAKDNPHLPPHYETFLRSIYPPAWVKRLMDGSWDVFIGQVYPQFSAELHEWKKRLPTGELYIPQFIRLVGGLDFGEPSNKGHKTAGIVGGITESGRLIRLDCFEEASDDVYERLAKWMAEMEEKWVPYLRPVGTASRNVVSLYTDTSRIMWCADKSQMGWIQEMRKAFLIRSSQGGRGSVRWGISLVANRLHPDQNGIPGSFYLPHMTKFHDAMVRYRWPEWDETQPPPSTPLKVDDDLVDADRYMHELLPTTIGAPEPYLFQIPRVSEKDDQRNPMTKVFGNRRQASQPQKIDLSYIFDEDKGDVLKIF